MHAYQLSQQLHQAGYTISVLADQRSRDGEDVVFDRGLDFTVQRIRLRRFRVLMYVQRFVKAYTLLQSSTVVIASGKFSLWLVGFYSLFLKRRYVAVIHGTEVNFRHPILRYFTEQSLKRFDRVVAVSQYTQGLVAPLGLEQLQVIPNGIDTSDWTLDSPLSLELQGSPKLLTVGQVSSRKGQLEVIRHLPQLLKDYPQLHYHCVGLTTEAASFMSMAESLGVASHITFHGRQSPAHLNAFYRSCDIFVMLSRATKSGDVEGFGIALLEANYFGMPCIGALGSGIEDAILNNQSGVLVTYDDTTAFVKAVSTILNDEDRFSEQAKAWALKHDWKLIVKRYVGVIESMV
jgi:phosphatidylinositol alpha-1,6-mannosyltransferase